MAKINLEGKIDAGGVHGGGGKIDLPAPAPHNLGGTTTIDAGSITPPASSGAGISAGAVATPRAGAATPGVDVVPQVDVSMPRVDTTAPKVDTTVPQVNVTTPKVDIKTEIDNVFNLLDTHFNEMTSPKNRISMGTFEQRYKTSQQIAQAITPVVDKVFPNNTLDTFRKAIAEDNGKREYLRQLSPDQMHYLQREAQLTGKAYAQAQAVARNASDVLKIDKPSGNVDSFGYTPHVTRSMIDSTLKKSQEIVGIQGLMNKTSYNPFAHRTGQVRLEDIDVPEAERLAFYLSRTAINNERIGKSIATLQDLYDDADVNKMRAADEFNIGNYTVKGEEEKTYVETVAEIDSEVAAKENAVTEAKERLADAELKEAQGEPISEAKTAENGSQEQIEGTTEYTKEQRKADEKLIKDDGPGDYVKQIIEARNRATDKDGNPLVVDKMRMNGGATANAASTLRQTLSAVSLDYAGQSRVLFDAIGAPQFRSRHRLGGDKVREMVETGKVIGSIANPDGTKSIALDTNALATWVNKSILGDTRNAYGSDVRAGEVGGASGMSTFANAVLTRRDRQCIMTYILKRVERAVQTYGETDQVKMVAEIQQVISGAYAIGSRKAVENVIKMYAPPEANGGRISTVTIGGKKYNNNVVTALQASFDLMNREGRDSSRAKRLLYSLMYSSALGGVTRGAVANLTETMAVMSVAGVSPKDIWAQVKALRPSEFSDRVLKYGDALGLDRRFLDEVAEKPNQLMNGLGDLAERGIEATTIPFDMTQKLSVVMFIMTAENMAKKRGIKEGTADFHTYVIETTSRLAIANDMYSTMNYTRLPGLRHFAPISMFTNFTLRDYNRVFDIGKMNTQQGYGAGTPWAIAGFAAYKVVAMMVLSYWGYSAMDAANINPFGLFDPYENLNEEDRNALDNIMTAIPFPYMLSPIIDLYWDLRKEQVARQTDDIGSVVSDVNFLQKAALGFFSDFIPAGGFFERTMKTVDAWDKGFALSMNGNKKFDVDYDPLNMLVAFVAGQNATRAGSIYNGRFNPFATLFDTGSVEETMREARNLLNDPVVGGILRGMGLWKETDLVRMANDDKYKEGDSYKEWRNMVRSEIPGMSFTGRSTDNTTWKQEAELLQYNQKNLIVEYRELISKAESSRYSEHERDQFRDKADKMMDEYIQKVISLRDGWLAAGHELDDTKINTLSRLLAVRDSDTPYFEGQAEYRKTVRPGNQQTQLTESMRDNLGIAEYNENSKKLTKRIKDTIGKDKQLAEARNRARRIIDSEFEKDKPDYDKINALQDEYMKLFDNKVKGVLGNNTFMLGYNDVADELAKYAMFKRDEWASTTKVSKRGKAYKQFISSKDFKYATGDKRKMIRDRYGYGEKGAIAYPTSDDAKTRRALVDIEQSARQVGRGDARRRAEELLRKIDRGEANATEMTVNYLESLTR